MKNVFSGSSNLLDAILEGDALESPSPSSKVDALISKIKQHLKKDQWVMMKMGSWLVNLCLLFSVIPTIFLLMLVYIRKRKDRKDYEEFMQKPEYW